MADQRDEFARRWAALKQERSSWVPHWQDISKVLMPRAGRFFVQDRNRGQKRHQSIYDGSATRSLRVLGAGLMGGMTSPARPWMRLSTADRQLNKVPAVRHWLADVTQLMLDIFAKSNTYRALHQGYEELGGFGTFASLVVSDFKSVIHHHPLTTGEYCIGTNWRGDVDTIYREFEVTVSSLAGEFGKDKISETARSLLDKSPDAWVPVIHAIEPRDIRDPGKRDARNMPWRSVYFEPAAKPGHYLREGGFQQFPAIVARWAVYGGDIYGTSPAMDALGDVRQLQHEQLRKGEAIDLQTKPPLQVPTSLKNREVDALPGGVTFVDQTSANNAIRSMFDVRLDLQHLQLDIQDVRRRIDAAMFTDLFLMFAGRDGIDTAFEASRLEQEKMMMLGPVLERLHNEELDPLVELTFEHMVRADILPPPPQEMQGVDLNVEFVSMLAQAQRAIATNGIDRFVSTLGQVMAIKPEIADKLDADRWADEYADMLGVDPRMVVAGEKVALIRQQRAQAAQAAQAAALAEQGASAAQKLAAVPTGAGANNAASNVIEMFSGY